MDVDRGALVIQAKFDKGVLRVTVPFTSAATPTKIAINAEPGAAALTS